MNTGRVAGLEEGMVIAGMTIQGQPIANSRFREEQNIRLNVADRDRPVPLMYVTVFTGRPPYYRPWIELFDIYSRFLLDGRAVEYYDSDLEYGILEFFSNALSPGENLFVEYLRDHEPKQQLDAGVPVPASRLGKLLFDMGFTWFKDWYFPEGFMEGEPKLQAERSLDPQAAKRQLGMRIDELEGFLKRTNTHRRTPYQRARQNAREIVRQYYAKTSDFS